MTYSQHIAFAIDNWIKAKPNRSISMLARLAQVSYSSTRRAAQRECESSKEVGLAIASVVMEEREYQEFVVTYFPHLKRYLVETAYRPNPNEQILYYLQSENYCKIVVLAGSSSGTNEDEVRERFGANAVNHFKELVEVGLLERMDNGNWQYVSDIGFSSYDLARTVLSLCTKICDKNNDYRKGASTSWVGWESVNEKTARRLYDLATDYTSEVSRIIKDPDNKGDVLIFSGILSNVLKGEELIK